MGNAYRKPFQLYVGMKIKVRTLASTGIMAARVYLAVLSYLHVKIQRNIQI